MNAFPMDTHSSDDEMKVRAELVRMLNLDSHAVEQIIDLMSNGAVDFGHAAIQLGYASQQEIDDAMMRVRVIPADATPSMFEIAIQRASGRQLVVKHGETVVPGPQLVLAHDADDPRSEKLRGLRTELLLLNEGGRGANIVAVLSPGAGEGRSQLSAELAIAFAQLGRRTLLVDADLRNPSQHLLFGTNNDEGLSSALSKLQKPIYKPVENLMQMHLLTAGPTVSNPLELLSDGRFERLITQWRNSYDFLVIDTPPVSKCADGIAVATLAQRVLILSRAQHTSYTSTRDTLRRLASTQSRILGAVINHF